MFDDAPRSDQYGAGGLCCMCYPGVALENVYCGLCVRREVATMTTAGSVEFTHIPSVESVCSAVIPMRYQSASLDQQHAAFALIDVLDQGVLISGPAGRGKTHQAAILMRRAIEAGMVRNPCAASAFQWHSAAGLLERMRGEMRKKDVTQSLMQQLIDARVLVIDDLGAEKPSEWVRERLYEIVNTRYERLRGVVVTTNLSVAQLERQLGARIASRLVEMCEVVELQGEQRRVA